MIDPALAQELQFLIFKIVFFFKRAFLVFLQRDSFLYWPFLLSTLLIGALAWRFGYTQLHASGVATWHEFRQHYLGKALWWHPSARVDYRFYLVNAVLFPILLGPLLFGENTVAKLLDGMTGLTASIDGKLSLQLQRCRVKGLIFVNELEL